MINLSSQFLVLIGLLINPNFWGLRVKDFRKTAFGKKCMGMGRTQLVIHYFRSILTWYSYLVGFPPQIDDKEEAESHTLLMRQLYVENCDKQETLLSENSWKVHHKQQ